MISLGIESSLRARVCFKDEGIGIEFGGRSNLGVELRRLGRSRDGSWSRDVGTGREVRCRVWNRGRGRVLRLG